MVNRHISGSPFWNLLVGRQRRNYTDMRREGGIYLFF